jgi:hypothetical protein
MDVRHGHDPRHRVVKCGGGFDVRNPPALEHEHAGNDREAVLDPVIGFPQQQGLIVAGVIGGWNVKSGCR